MQIFHADINTYKNSNSSSVLQIDPYNEYSNVFTVESKKA